MNQWKSIKGSFLNLFSAALVVGSAAQAQTSDLSLEMIPATTSLASFPEGAQGQALTRTSFGNGILALKIEKPLELVQIENLDSPLFALKVSEKCWISGFRGERSEIENLQTGQTYPIPLLNQPGDAKVQKGYQSLMLVTGNPENLGYAFLRCQDSKASDRTATIGDFNQWMGDRATLFGHRLMGEDPNFSASMKDLQSENTFMFLHVRSDIQPTGRYTQFPAARSTERRQSKSDYLVYTEEDGCQLQQPNESDPSLQEDSDKPISAGSIYEVASRNNLDNAIHIVLLRKSGSGPARLFFGCSGKVVAGQITEIEIAFQGKLDFLTKKQFVALEEKRSWKNNLPEHLKEAMDAMLKHMRSGR